jgi:hypothetical protein
MNIPGTRGVVTTAAVASSLPPSPVAAAAASLPSYSPPRIAVQAAIKDIRKVTPKQNNWQKPELRIRIRWIRMFLGLLDPDPDPLVRVLDPDPSITKQK